MSSVIRHLEIIICHAGHVTIIINLLWNHWHGEIDVKQFVSSKMMLIFFKEKENFKQGKRFKSELLKMVQLYLWRSSYVGSTAPQLGSLALAHSILVQGMSEVVSLWSQTSPSDWWDLTTPATTLQFRLRMPLEMCEQQQRVAAGHGPCTDATRHQLGQTEINSQENCCN